MTAAPSSPAFFDTSALLPVFAADHLHHGPSIRIFESLPPSGPHQAFCSLHSLAEVFATTTRIPPPSRMPPDESLFHIKQVLKRIQTVAWNEVEYLSALSSIAENNLSGALIYDALLLQCARKVNAETIYTWN